MFFHQVKQKQKFQSCISDLISTGTVSLSAQKHCPHLCSNIINEGRSDYIAIKDVVLLLLLSFCVSSAGCHVFLPGGAELLFPPGCLLKTTRLEWAVKRPEREWVQLEEHDILLSRPLELRPHGITFLKV